MQYLLGAWDDSRYAGYAVVLEDGRVDARLRRRRGRPRELRVRPADRGARVVPLVATFDAATGDATLRLDPTNESVSSHLLPGTSQARGDHKRFRVPFPPAVATVPFRIGAGSTGNAGFPEGVGHFNGKIGNPRVYPTARVADGASPLAEWDFARSDRADRRAAGRRRRRLGRRLPRRLHQQPDAGRDGLQLDGPRAELPARPGRVRRDPLPRRRPGRRAVARGVRRRPAERPRERRLRRPAAGRARPRATCRSSSGPGATAGATTWRCCCRPAPTWRTPTTGCSSTCPAPSC